MNSFRRRKSGSSLENLEKKCEQIKKTCQSSKIDLHDLSPNIIEILNDYQRIFQEIFTHYEERFDELNEIHYFRIFIENFYDLSSKICDCCKQSNQRKDFNRFLLYFSHNLTELKAFFSDGIFHGEQFRLTKSEANQFWRANFPSKILISWNEFREKFEQVHPIDDLSAFKDTIDLTHNNHVSIFEFDVFTRLFHPWSTLITNWKLLTQIHPGFMAFLTYDQVKTILNKFLSKPGSYLFRLSCTHLGQWVIGYVSNDQKVLQTIPRNKSLVQSLIDGQDEGFYKYPMGENVYVDLSTISTRHESQRINVSKEQMTMYSNMDTTFELCKICSANTKNCQIEPCGHLICENCLTTWQKNNHSKPSIPCPFCRSEIKGFQSIIIDSTESLPPPPIPPRPIHVHSVSTSQIQQDTIRTHLISEFGTIDRERIDAVLILTRGLSSVKQYQLCKEFLLQLLNEYE